MEVLKDFEKTLSEKGKISRRGFIQGLGALTATAAVYGCGGGKGEGPQSFVRGATVTPQKIEFDHTMTTVMSSHPFNCGGRCGFKYFVKNGRVVKLTALGDISRGTTKEEVDAMHAADESVDLVQKRACVRGYNQIKRNYAPDRLKYPLKQTIEKGNLKGFVRIEWDEAMEKVVSWIEEMMVREDTLGYLPIFGFYEHMDLIHKLGHAIYAYGNPSSGNQTGAKKGAIGAQNKSNSVVDMLNSKFILNWGNDATTSFNHQASNHWFLTKAREEGVPIVTIDSKCTDTVAPLSTGFGEIPAWIPIRPMTDVAMQVAMANVIYRDKDGLGLLDTGFIQDYCFGFYPGDTTTHPNTGAEYAVPEGQSFVEYLDELETEHGGYDGVLAWASNLTGVSAEIIEKLAKAFASTKPALMYGGNGPQRTETGLYYIWGCHMLAAMTGNTLKKGGGPGDNGYSTVDWVFLLPRLYNPYGQYPFWSLGEKKSRIKVSFDKWGDVLLNGTDGRTPEQLRADVLQYNGIDLGDWTENRNDEEGHDGRLRIEMLFGAPYTNNGLNQCPNINKNLVAVMDPKLKHSVVIDNFVTTSGRYADIVLPQDNHFERDGMETKESIWYRMNKAVEPMYECRNAARILEDIAKTPTISARLKSLYDPDNQMDNLMYGRGGVDDEQVMEKIYEKVRISTAYLTEVDPDVQKPSFEDFSNEGRFQLPIPREKAVIGGFYNNGGVLKPLTAEGRIIYETDTGKINFYSPYFASRQRARSNRFQYVRPLEGYEKLLDEEGNFTGMTGKKGMKYTLQLITSHARNRVHTIYDNVPQVKDLFPQVVKINHEDAAERGISDGELVYIFNDRGCIKIPAMVTKRMMKGVVNIDQGGWYRPSLTETYKAHLDLDGDGLPDDDITEVAVDMGGAPNILIHDLPGGPQDPTVGGGLSAGGHIVEVSKNHPDK